MNKLAFAAIAAGMMISANGALAETKKPAKPEPAPITYTINVGVTGKIVQVNVSGTKAVTVDVPNNGGKLIVAEAGPLQAVGELIDKGARKLGGDAKTTRRHIQVTLVAADGKSLKQTAVLCSGRAGDAFYADFAAHGQQALCGAKSQ